MKTNAYVLQTHKRVCLSLLSPLLHRLRANLHFLLSLTHNQRPLSKKKKKT